METLIGGLGIIAIILGAIYLLFLILIFLFRQLSNDWLLVTLYVSRVPTFCLVTSIGIKALIPRLQPPVPSLIALWLDRGLGALCIGIVSYWIVQLTKEVLIYALRDYAERSEVMWDDVLVPLSESLLPFMTYLVGMLLALQVLGIDLSGILVALGGAAFILGFALKDILANFFSGLVLLIDTPFNFGDVISLSDNYSLSNSSLVSLGDGSRAVIKKIGLRLTHLYLIDTHSELYIPNANLQSQNIINLSRPTNHYYYTVSIPIKADVDPRSAIELMEKVVLAHPDTMGDIEGKLEALQMYYGYSLSRTQQQEKRESGQLRLLAERDVTKTLAHIEGTLTYLSELISKLEKGGLNINEMQTIQNYYLEICELIGLEMKNDRRKRSKLVEIGGVAPQNTLIGQIRLWYQAWLKDPSLFKEDRVDLPKEWERKIQLLILKVNRLAKIIKNPSGQETRLDDQVQKLQEWMQENFKSSRNEWQDPKIWVQEVEGDYTRNTIVRFYVDNIKMEHCERGNRVKSEVRQELTWHLRRAYLCN